jgi:hypothetical protein
MTRFSQIPVKAATQAAPQLCVFEAQRPSLSALAFRRGAFPGAEPCLQSCSIPTLVPDAFRRSISKAVPSGARSSPISQFEFFLLDIVLSPIQGRMCRSHLRG